jgi:hypothetical protein
VIRRERRPGPACKKVINKSEKNKKDQPEKGLTSKEASKRQQEQARKNCKGLTRKKVNQ